MGQELLDRVGFVRTKPKYYLAVNSKGFMVVRGTTTGREYTHAVISINPWYSGYCYATFTTRLDLANRYCKRNNSHHDNPYWEVVEVKEITTKEARQLKNDIHAKAVDYQEVSADKTAQVYQIERETNGD